MEKQELQPVKANVKDKQGNDIYNLNLKTRVDKTTGEVSIGLKPGHYIELEKVFVEGYEHKKPGYNFYSCKAIYQGQEVSFILSEREHDMYKELGGIGDIVRISAESYTYKYQGVEKKGLKLNFERVN